MNMNDRPSSTSRRRGRRGPAAFTLTEVLVVIGIISLIAILAVPSFRALSGGRSTEAAQNTISAVLARARTEALGLQKPRGVLFYRDLESRRVGMVLVETTPIFPGETSAASFGLDLVADRSPVLLPVGVGIQFVDDVLPVNPPGTSIDRYIGFNTLLDRANANPPEPLEIEVPFGGAILFDAKGRLMSDTYAFRFRYPPGALGYPDVRVAELGRFLRNEVEMPAGPIGPGRPSIVTHDPAPVSKLGFVLFNEEDFAAVFREDRGTDMTEDQDFQHDMRIATFGAVGPTPPSNPTNEAEEEHWLSQNGLPLLVNRYNGTLIRGE